MPRVSKKLQTQIFEAVRGAHFSALSEYLPDCVTTPPERWSASEREKCDLLNEAEYRATAVVCTGDLRCCRS
jgi:hypothetical protein